MTNEEFWAYFAATFIVVVPFIFTGLYGVLKLFSETTLFQYLFKKKDYDFYKRYELDNFSGLFCKSDKLIYKYKKPFGSWGKMYKHEYKSAYPHLARNEVRRCYIDVFEKIPYKEIKYKDFKNATELKRSFSIAVKK